MPWYFLSARLGSPLTRASCPSSRGRANGVRCWYFPPLSRSLCVLLASARWFRGDSDELEHGSSAAARMRFIGSYFHPLSHSSAPLPPSLLVLFYYLVWIYLLALVTHDESCGHYFEPSRRENRWGAHCCFCSAVIFLCSDCLRSWRTRGRILSGDPCPDFVANDPKHFISKSGNRLVAIIQRILRQIWSTWTSIQREGGRDSFKDSSGEESGGGVCWDQPMENDPLVSHSEDEVGEEEEERGRKLFTHLMQRVMNSDRSFVMMLRIGQWSIL